MLKAIEMSGRVDEQHRLQLDRPVPIGGPSSVRVIILVNEDPDLDEASWLHAAATNPAFAFLGDPREDIYSLKDGTPFHDQG